jgi:uncharacterized protein
MPGNPKGTSAQVYAHRFLDRIVKNFNYLIDLHTASFGRINSFYVRADLNCPTTDWMARLPHASIILHNSGPDGALRSAAADMGIHAITLELGNPMLFQKHLFIPGLSGILNVLSRLEMLPQHEIPPRTPPLVCRRSYWIYTTTGGLLDVLPPLGKIISKGEKVAKVMNIFGDTLEEYFSPEDCVVIGRSTNPVNQTGSRILHLGVIGE